MTDDFVLTVAPYAALALCIAALTVRCGLASRRPAEADANTRPGWRTAAARYCGVAIAFVAVVHIVVLLLPEEVLRWNALPSRLYILEAVNLTIGIAALVCWAMVAWRSLVVSAGSLIRHVADSAFLALLFVEVSSGLATAVLYRWASSWAASTLAPYTRSLFGGEPAAALVKGLPFVVQIHVATAFLLMAVFPFTGIAALLIRAAGRRLTLLLGPVAAHVRSAGTTLQQRYNPSEWVWPEEEE